MTLIYIVYNFNILDFILIGRINFNFCILIFLETNFNIKVNIQSSTMYKDCPNYFITKILKTHLKFTIIEC